MPIRFGESETTTIAELREGDFVETIPSQEGVRGLKVDSGIEWFAHVDIWESSWKSGPPRHRQPIASVKLKFMRSKSVYELPAHFTVSVRRRLAEVNA